MWNKKTKGDKGSHRETLRPAGPTFEFFDFIYSLASRSFFSPQLTYFFAVGSTFPIRCLCAERDKKHTHTHTVKQQLYFFVLFFFFYPYFLDLSPLLRPFFVSNAFGLYMANANFLELEKKQNKETNVRRRRNLWFCSCYQHNTRIVYLFNESVGHVDVIICFLLLHTTSKVYIVVNFDFTRFYSVCLQKKNK